MNVIFCSKCNQNIAQIRRPSTLEPYCKVCFIDDFEKEIHSTIIQYKLFTKGERVVIAVSGGKDSTVLAYLISKLNEKYNYGIDLILLAIDEGIQGYRNEALKCVKQNEIDFGIPLTILSYKDIYGWSMDEIVAAVGKKNNCTFCGVFRRQAIDRGAIQVQACKICTGHNADDAAETVIMNILRGDINRIRRCSDPITGTNSQFNLPRCKPLMFAYEKEIVFTECKYSPNAYRGYVRDFIKSLEASNPQYILNILKSFNNITCPVSPDSSEEKRCMRCNWISSNTLCKACILLDGLNNQNNNIASWNKAKQKNSYLTNSELLDESCACTLNSKNK